MIQESNCEFARFRQSSGMKRILVFTSLILSIIACESAVRNTVYSAYEKIGIEKRDLLKRRVNETREEEKQAGDTFKDALDKFQSLYAFDGGNLDKEYKTAKASHERAVGKADDVHKSIKKMETVAQDLFIEWEQEAGKIETSSLRSKSREMLADTKKRYADLDSSLRKSEARMEPVLAKFNDQVLYLKHNLNAQAITSLKGESANIQKDIEHLVSDMNKSIAEADQFIANLK
jgi:hypothetical protein